MRTVLLIGILFLGSPPDTCAQSRTDSAVVAATFNRFHPPAAKARAFIDVRKPSGKLHLNPLYYLTGSAMFVYQRVISEQISADCQYAVSCSEYTKKSIEFHGLIKGTLFGLHQLSHCTPICENDFCGHELTNKGKIINLTE